MEPFIGQIQPFGFNFNPRGWAMCDGQILPIDQNTALFSLLGTTYGGDGMTTFGLPDLRGRVAIHWGSGAGLSARTWGERSGSESHNLTVGQLPSHNHRINAVDDSPNQGSPSGTLAQDSIYSTDMADTQLASTAVSNTGNNQSVNHMPPFLAVTWCIALTGIFPSRN